MKVDVSCHFDKIFRIKKVLLKPNCEKFTQVVKKFDLFSTIFNIKSRLYILSYIKEKLESQSHLIAVE